MTKQEVFSVQELAARWHRHPETIYRWIRRGYVKTVGVGFRKRGVALATVEKIEKGEFASMHKSKRRKARKKKWSELVPLLFATGSLLWFSLPDLDRDGVSDCAGLKFSDSSERLIAP